MILSPEVWGNMKWAGNVMFSSPFLWMIRPNVVGGDRGQCRDALTGRA